MYIPVIFNLCILWIFYFLFFFYFDLSSFIKTRKIYPYISVNIKSVFHKKLLTQNSNCNKNIKKKL